LNLFQRSHPVISFLSLTQEYASYKTL
jgi:hypothetical protein